jgi:hypothetical protein
MLAGRRFDFDSDTECATRSVARTGRAVPALERVGCAPLASGTPHSVASSCDDSPRELLGPFGEWTDAFEPIRASNLQSNAWLVDHQPDAAELPYAALTEREHAEV